MSSVSFKMSRTPGGASLLSFSSAAPSANGSAVTIDNTVEPSGVPKLNVGIHEFVAGRRERSTWYMDLADGSSTSGYWTVQAADTLTFSGHYFFEMNYIDSGDSDRVSQPIRGELLFKPSMTG